jgi:kynurenine formamidase
MILKIAGAIALSVWLSSTFAGDTWYPSKWGKDDQLGAFNMLGPEQTMKAAKLIKTGKTYRLGIESNTATPAYAPRNMHVIVLNPGQAGGKSLGSNKMTYADDIINGWVGVGSQIDGLGHAGVDSVYYNGTPAADFMKPDGLTKFGTHIYPPIVTRGLMLDMAMCARKDLLEAGTAFKKEDIEACAKKENVSIEKGDVVLFNTGWISLVGKDNDRFNKGEPGLGITGAEYLANVGVMAIGADNWALEVLPAEIQGEAFHIHQILLAKSGIYILENMDTRELAKDKGYEFMFALGPARITGAVQAIINPIAIR